MTSAADDLVTVSQLADEADSSYGRKDNSMRKMAVAVAVLVLGLSGCSREGEPQQIGQSPGGQSGGTVAPATTAAPAKCPTEPVTLSALGPWTMVSKGQPGTPDKWNASFTATNPNPLLALLEKVTATVQVQRGSSDRLGQTSNAFATPSQRGPAGGPLTLGNLFVPARSSQQFTLYVEMPAGSAIQQRDLFASGYLMTSEYWYTPLSAINTKDTCPLTIKGAQPLASLPNDVPTCVLGGPKYPC